MESPFFSVWRAIKLLRERVRITVSNCTGEWANRFLIMASTMQITKSSRHSKIAEIILLIDDLKNTVTSGSNLGKVMNTR